MKKKEAPEKELKKSLNQYLKFSTLVLQMGIYIALGAYGGKWLDGEYAFSKPWFTILGTLLGLGLGLYLVLRALKSSNDS